MPSRPRNLYFTAVHWLAWLYSCALAGTDQSQLAAHQEARGWRCLGLVRLPAGCSTSVRTTNVVETPSHGSALVWFVRPTVEMLQLLQLTAHNSVG